MKSKPKRELHKSHDKRSQTPQKALQESKMKPIMVKKITSKKKQTKKKKVETIDGDKVNINTRHS